ncbi:glycoside hydrolase family 65 protein [Bacillus sp. 1P06AnD]|uniref:glycoside hydrolase family 65 protein n=1 Tax=Bacillus sp. 1P06AnD TaxID=3132208 RepID=UPI0039A09061
MIQRIFDIHPWKLSTTALDKDHKRLQESLTSIGNGYMGMRGNFEEGYSGDTHRGTYIAGIWYPDKTRVGWWKNGYPDYFGKVINAMNFIGIEVLINGEKVDLNKDEVSDFYMELDMKEGIFRREFTVIKKGEAYSIHAERFLSADQKELAVIRYAVKPLTAPAHITLVSYLDGNVRNEDANYEETFWVEMAQNADELGGYLSAKTKENDFGTPRFTVAAAMSNKVSVEAEQGFRTDSLYCEQSYSFKLEADQEAAIEKRVVIATSRDTEEGLVLQNAEKMLGKLQHVCLEEIKERHIQAWAERWKKADIVIEGDDEAQQGIRFAIFQLFATYYGEDPRLNIGPKGFTGEKYGGATYWDTEAFALPLYLAIAGKDVSRNLLKYRYNQLEQAKNNARKLGLDGALYPMVTFTGDECHNEWEITFEEIHRNGAIAYAIYNYTTYTGDKEYLEEYGLDVLVEISRFWADRVHMSQRLDQYMIHGVTGPNEYENNVNNNWYTNFMASWTLRYTLEQLTEYKEEQLKITKEEKAKWQDIVSRMYLPYDSKWQIFVQHDTFLDKELRSTDTLSASDRPINQKWSWDKILRSCFIKQADVLQGIYLFSEDFDFDTKQRNYEFYEPLTVHESSLSPAVHSILAAELGKQEKAVELYKRTARLDLDNYNNDTEDGLHITSMPGSWLSIVQGFAGMRTTKGRLSLSPFLPAGWEGYTFKLTYRERLLEVSVREQNVTVTLLEGKAFTLTLYGMDVLLEGSVTRSERDVE